MNETDKDFSELRGKCLPALVWSFGLLLFFLPLAHTRAAQNSLTALSVLLFLITLARRPGTLFRDIPKPLLLTLAAWVALTTLSCAWSPEPLLSLRLVVESVWLPLLFFLLAFRLSQRGEPLAILIPWACLGLAALCGASLSALMFGRIDILQTGSGTDLAAHPLMRWYPGPGLTSTFVLLALPFVYWIYREALLPRWIAGLAAALLLTGAASLNRMFWLVLPLIGIILFLGDPGKRRHSGRSPRFWFVIGLAVFAVLGLVLAGTVVRSGLFHALFDGSLVKKALLTDPRWLIWDSWIAVGLENHPLLGTGYGKEVAQHAYAAALAERVAAGMSAAGISHPHNIVLSIWIQTGVAGILSFAALVVGMLAAARGLYKKPVAVRHHAAALLSLIGVMVIKNMTDDFYDRIPAILYWSYFGLILGYGIRQSARAENRAATEQPRILILKRDKLGDMLLATPMLACLRQHFPEARIDVLANTYNAWVLDGNPHINKVWAYEKVREGARLRPWAALAQVRQVLELRRQRYDWIIVANGEFSHRAITRAAWLGGRRVVAYAEALARPACLTDGLTPPSGVHEARRMLGLLAPLGISPPEQTPPVHYALPDSAADFALAWLAERGLRPGHYITLGLGARRAKRQPSAEQVQRWTHYFYQHWGLQTVFMWTPGRSDNPLYPGDDDIAQPVLDANMPWLHPFRGPIKPALGLIWHGRTSLFPDSGLMHFAAASPGGVLGFFAEIDASPPPAQWSPVGPRARWLEAAKTLADLSDETVFAALETLASPKQDDPT